MYKLLISFLGMLVLFSSALSLTAQQPTECSANSRAILDTVTLIEYGAFDIQDLGVDIPLVDVANSTSSYINVRLAPTTVAGVLITLAPRQVITANGQLADGSWYRVRLPTDPSRLGWVSASVVSSEQNTSSLQVVDAQDMEVSPYLPMQAFQAEPLETDDGCATPGLLLQTPLDANSIAFIVNGVEITLDTATLWIQILDSSQMVINTLEGSARVKADNTLQFVPAGGMLRIPIGTDLTPSSAPSSLVAYDASVLPAAPVQSLARPITPAAALTDAQLATLLVPLSGQWYWYFDAWYLQESSCQIILLGELGSIGMTVTFTDEGRTMLLTDAMSKVRSYSQLAPGIYVSSQAETLPDGSQPRWEYTLTVLSPYLISESATLTIGDCTVNAPLTWLEWVSE